MTKAKPVTIKKRLWLFRGMAVVVGLLPLLVLESVLTIANLPATPASDDPLVDLHQLKPLFVRSTNKINALSKEGAKWEIPESRHNFFRPESFPAKKSTSEFRIFVLGGSTVQGRPFATETAFPTWLELALNAVDDSTQWNAINCGGISYASYRLAPILDEVLDHDPDLIILYTGHNEFLEERTYESLKQFPPIVARMAHALGELRTMQLLRNILVRQTNKEATSRWVAGSEVKTRLDIAGGLADFTRNEKWRSNVIQHFEITLERMLNRCRQANVPVIICVPASDVLDTPPFKLERAPGLTPKASEEINQLWGLASRADAASKDRINASAKILILDPQHAGAAFVRGRLLYDQRRFDEAKKWLQTARDWDVCPLRAPSEIQQVVKRLAQEYQVPCLDTSGKLGALVDSGLPGGLAFVDHVHPTVASHQKIGLWLLELTAAGGFVELPEGWRSRVDAAFRTHLGSLGEEYFVRGKQRLEGLRQWAAGRAGELSVDSGNMD